jgi:hypothetical protein
MCNYRRAGQPAGAPRTMVGIVQGWLHPALFLHLSFRTKPIRQVISQSREFAHQSLVIDR